MHDDEGPSDEDIERFSAEHGWCPDCGAQVWDGADVCPSCNAWIGGHVLSRPPVVHWWNKRTKLLVVIVVIAAFAVPVLVRLFR